MKGFGIEIKNNLLDPKHVDGMGQAVWLYIWLIDGMTSITEEGIGIVRGGRPIRFEEVREDLGMSPDTYTRWIDKLSEYPYIATTRTPRGIVFKVFKAYKKWKKRIRENAESVSAEMRNHDRRNAESNKTVIPTELPVDNNSKTAKVVDNDVEKLKNKFFSHQLFEKLQGLQFSLMCDWYLAKKKRLPKAISAFSNWLSNTKPDEAIIAQRKLDQEKSESRKRLQEMENTKPVSPETLDKLRQQKAQLVAQKSIS
ncbi:MAG: hypothetical protein M1275_02560 [Patescibacteria group bacterium]|nr:hypothetical protein [Patescibacteria group bacterium]